MSDDLITRKNRGQPQGNVRLPPQDYDTRCESGFRWVGDEQGQCVDMRQPCPRGYVMQHDGSCQPETILADDTGLRPQTSFNISWGWLAVAGVAVYFLFSGDSKKR